MHHVYIQVNFFVSILENRFPFNVEFLTTTRKDHHRLKLVIEMSNTKSIKTRSAGCKLPLEYKDVTGRTLRTLAQQCQIWFRILDLIKQ
jgi:hypothetical protein